MLLDQSIYSLIGTMPSNLMNLADLGNLNLSRNKLVDLIPSGLAQMWSLEIFYYAYNDLACLMSSRVYPSPDDTTLQLH